MKPFALLLLAIAAVAGAVIFLMAIQPHPVTPSVVPPPARSIQPSVSPAPLVAHSARPLNEIEVPTREAAPATPATPDSAAQTPLLGAPAEAKARIQLLASTYDAALVPELAAYLNHPLADVREQAQLGLVLLGDASAIPFLRLAALRAEGTGATQEAVALAQAAEVLSQTPSTPETRERPVSLAQRQQERRLAEKKPEIIAKDADAIRR